VDRPEYLAIRKRMKTVDARRELLRYNARILTALRMQLADSIREFEYNSLEEAKIRDMPRRKKKKNS